MVSFDYGIVTDRNVLPITQLNLGGQTATNAAATAKVGDVRCGPTPFGKYIRTTGFLLFVYICIGIEDPIIRRVRLGSH